MTPFVTRDNVIVMSYAQELMVTSRKSFFFFFKLQLPLPLNDARIKNSHICTSNTAWNRYGGHRRVISRTKNSFEDRKTDFGTYSTCFISAFTISITKANMRINLFIGQLLKDFQILTDNVTAPVHVESASVIELGISWTQNLYHFHFYYMYVHRNARLHRITRTSHSLTAFQHLSLRRPHCYSRQVAAQTAGRVLPGSRMAFEGSHEKDTVSAYRMPLSTFSTKCGFSEPDVNARTRPFFGSTVALPLAPSTKTRRPPPKSAL